MTWDYKSQLQEYCQSHKIKLYYQPKSEKRSKHQQLFTVEAILEDQSWKEDDQVKKKKIIFQETGMGKSKKEAEQEAAAKVLAKIVPEQK
jgi:dsRNA-specific ribonuclease